MRDVEISVPGPRDHLRGTLALLDRFEALAGRPDCADALRRFLDRPGDLPATVSREASTLKYDAYLTQRQGSLAWGIATSERYDPGFEAAVRRFVAELTGRWRLDAVEAVRAGLPPHGRVFAVGFDSPGAPPRLKLYLQEDRWSEGVGTRRTLRLPEGCRLPDWIPADRPIGVVTVELRADGSVTAKAYLGGPTAAEAAAGAPAEARDLVEALGDVADPGGYWYLTVRMGGDRVRYAINKIVDHVSAGFTRDPRRLAGAWAEVDRWFARAGRTTDLVRRATTLPGVRVVPTAMALEDAATSADVYCGAWATR